jgi:NAD-dependent SIR2 family protein deacetylase
MPAKGGDSKSRFDPDDGQVPGCAQCGENHPFELPSELLDAAFAGTLVVFAGAGISTESPLRLGAGLFTSIATELGDGAESHTFPQLMSAYEKEFGRSQLLQRIRARFDYINGFPLLRADASRFHRTLSTAFFLDQIVTTNWDTYFEDRAAATPIVIPEDYAFWNLPGRKVFKLHGSMNNLGTIVATEEDYARCYRRLRDGPIGGSLKHLLATRRIVFIGYSFGDSDLDRILNFVRREMGDVLPRSFLVTPHSYDGRDFPQERVITTDGTYFMRRLKQAAVDHGVMRPDSVYATIDELAMRVSRARQRSARAFKVGKFPAAIYNWAYQDGLLHAFGRILALESSGEYSNTHSHRVASYELARKGALRTRQYFDAAYILGYRNGLMALEMNAGDTELMPVYFVWGSGHDLRDFGDFKGELLVAPRLHRAATRKAERIVAGSGGLVPVHDHFLDADEYVARARRGVRRR